jgi:hypothetical protein
VRGFAAMKRFIKTVAGIALGLVAFSLVWGVVIFATLCAGHTHGVC